MWDMTVDGPQGEMAVGDVFHIAFPAPLAARSENIRRLGMAVGW